MSVRGDAIVNPDTGERFRDGKRYLWLFSLIYPLLPSIFIGLAWSTGVLAWLWAMPFVYLILVPALDTVLGEDFTNPPEWAVRGLEQDGFYSWLVNLTVPCQYVTVVVGAWAVAEAGFPWWGILGMLLSVSYASGIAVNTGHELGHKKTRLERWLAKFVLAVTAYGHFFIEHNKGHHRDVATPEDPASSRMGENFWKFAYTREIPGAARRAWNLEKERLARMGKSPFSLHNEVVQTTLITVALYGGLTWAFGWVVLPFLLAQALLGGYMNLSLANYVEHYGLLRQKLPNGRYERCRPEHSWNTNHIMSNLLSYHLQRHSDHHAHPTRRYQALRDFDGIPRLPSGYPTMFSLALVPPLWRKVMDRRVLEHYGYDLNRVNVDPGKRDELFARYHRPPAESGGTAPA